ncbi:MAG: hypothetical protein GF393_09300 [Armatimonadia bacterium]|nr:hypothetical protein [Armatimonadia bacterium]
MVQIGIIIVLIVAGVLIWRAGSKMLNEALEGEQQAIEAEETTPEAPIEPVGPVGPDGLMVLFADRFVDRSRPGKMVSPRAKCYAPLTEEEMDAHHWAHQILYVTLIDLYEQGCIDFRTTDRMATLMPPYPQKTWEMQICQIGPMPEAPISDALAVAFGLLRKRAQGQDAQEERHWVTLDALIEQALKSMRQEMSFWQRSGVFGDIRQYVESALIAQGWLLEPGKPTWLDRVRTQRPMPHEDVLELEEDAKQLAEQMAQFQAKHGGNLLPEDDRETESLRQADAALLCPPDEAPELPTDEMLRMSIYETLLAIRQLEPSGDAGV